MTETNETDYLFRMLQMNPLEQSEEIIDLRCDFLKSEIDLDMLLKESISLNYRNDQHNSIPGHNLHLCCRKKCV